MIEDASGEGLDFDKQGCRKSMLQFLYSLLLKIVYDSVNFNIWLHCSIKWKPRF